MTWRGYHVPVASQVGDSFLHRPGIAAAASVLPQSVMLIGAVVFVEGSSEIATQSMF